MTCHLNVRFCNATRQAAWSKLSFCIVHQTVSHTYHMLSSCSCAQMAHAQMWKCMCIFVQKLLNDLLSPSCVDFQWMCCLSISHCELCCWHPSCICVLPQTLVSIRMLILISFSWFIMCQICWRWKLTPARFTVRKQLFVNWQHCSCVSLRLSVCVERPLLKAEWHERVREEGSDPAQQCVCGMQSGAAGYRRQHWLLALPGGGCHPASEPERWHTHVHPLRPLESLFSGR